MNIYNFLDCDNDDVDDDFEEFLFQSIRRYNTLQMFNLENVPCHVFPLDCDSICVASRRTTGSSELLKLKLPVKLTLPAEEEGLSKENDFKVLSGIYVDNLIYQIRKLGSDNLVLTSEINTAGLQMYSFTENSTVNKNKMEKLDFTNWSNPDFMVSHELPRVICSKCCHHPLIEVDVSINKKLKDIKHPFFTSDASSQEQSADACLMNNIKCDSLGANLIVVLDTRSGHVFLHDLRTDDVFTSLPVASEASSDIWTLSECNSPGSSLDYFGILSSASNFCIYDIRKNGILFQRKSKNQQIVNDGNMKMRFSKKEKKFSLSGMNSFVEIFKMNGNYCEPVFTHNGHCPKNMPSVLVTDHFWLQVANREYVVSICDNKTIHCWN